jgi:hypothetical protein
MRAGSERLARGYTRDSKPRDVLMMAETLLVFLRLYGLYRRLFNAPLIFADRVIQFYAWNPRDERHARALFRRGDGLVHAPLVYATFGPTEQPPQV